MKRRLPAVASLLAALAGCTWIAGIDKDYVLATSEPEGGSPSEGGSDAPAESSADAEAGVLEPIAVEAHYDVTCAVLSDGHVRCWGANYASQAGAEEDAGAVVSSAVEVKGINAAIAVTTGFDHACALLRDGRVFCWGANDFGQLGRPLAETGVRSATPFEVQGLPAGDPVRSLSAGGQYTCAIVNSARIFCWGTGPSGAIFEQDAAAPVAPKELVLAGGTPLFVTVRAENFHTCAISTTAWTYCWGENVFEQLGRVLTMGSENPPMEGPPGGSVPAMLASGQTHTCRHDATNGLMCFGSNLFGQRGRAIPLGTQNWIPTPIDGMRLDSGTISATAGTLVTCVTRADGRVVCVGTNGDGQLGDPAADAGEHVDPVVVQGLTDALAASAGSTHVCALRKAGAPNGGKSVVCWGSNVSGQLGSAIDGGTSVPTPVVGLD